MRDRLLERWRALLALTPPAAGATDEALEDWIEAACWAGPLAVLGFAVPEDEAKHVRAQLAARVGDTNDELRPFARAALDAVTRLLAGEDDPAGPVWPADLLAPSATRLDRLLRGELDGFAALSVAGYLRAHPRDRRVLRAMLDLPPAAEPRLQVAAASAARMRDPEEGQVVAEVEGVAELVLFARPSPRQVAVYAARPVAVRLEGEGLTTSEIAPGYWLGTLSSAVRSPVEVTLHLDDDDPRTLTLRW